jgi:hypothetical protein
MIAHIPSDRRYHIPDAPSGKLLNNQVTMRLFDGR